MLCPTQNSLLITVGLRHILVKTFDCVLDQHWICRFPVCDDELEAIMAIENRFVDLKPQRYIPVLYEIL